MAHPRHGVAGRRPAAAEEGDQRDQRGHADGPAQPRARALGEEIALLDGGRERDDEADHDGGDEHRGHGGMKGARDHLAVAEVVADAQDSRRSGADACSDRHEHRERAGAAADERE